MVKVKTTVLFHVPLGVPALRPAAEPLPDRIDGGRPSWPGLGLNQDVVAKSLRARLIKS